VIGERRGIGAQHHARNILRNDIDRADGLFFIEGEYDRFFPLKDEKSEDTEEKDDAEKEDPEEFYAEPFDVTFSLT
jgi:hypothetical protein